MTSLQAIKETVEKLYISCDEPIPLDEAMAIMVPLLRLAEELEAKVKVAETALQQADDLVGEKVALLSTNRLKGILTAALAEIRG